MKSTQCAMGAGSDPPTSDDAAELGSGGGIKEEQATTDSHDSAAYSTNREGWPSVQAHEEARAMQDRAQSKKFERLRALLAIHGLELYRTDGGPFIVRRWGKTRDLQDLAAVEEFAKQVGAS